MTLWEQETDAKAGQLPRTNNNACSTNDLEEERCGCSKLNKPAQSRDQAVTHPEEEDAPHQHRDDRHEAYGIRDPPNIVQVACLIWSFVLMKTG